MLVKKVIIDNLRHINLNDFDAVTRRGKGVFLSVDKDYQELIENGHQIIKDHTQKHEPIYGVTTGFGDSCRNNISYNDAKTLQKNLVLYHGCGIGKYFSPQETLGILLLRLQSIAIGCSGVPYHLLKQLENFINIPILPLIPEQGSVGASGDLTPLSYVAAALCGQRQVIFRNSVMESKLALQKNSLSPLELEPKEGLALMNGTSVMTAIACFSLLDAEKIASLAELTTTLTVEVLKGNKGSFSSFIHKNKRHPGQIRCAENINKMIMSSKIALSHEQVINLAKPNKANTQHNYLSRHIQDKYSLRCAPQVIGVLHDTISWVKEWVEIEMNSVNDNPLIDPESGNIYSGGNFYGGHICTAMDCLRSIIASVADLIDKQIELIIDEKFNQGLGSNLVNPKNEHSYLCHGFKAMQITLSSLVAEIMHIANPVSTLSRPTEALNQDKVSLGTISSRYSRNVIQMTFNCLAIQILALCQAIEIRGEEKFSAVAKDIFQFIRESVPFTDQDREMDSDIIKITEIIKNDKIYNIIADHLK